MPLAESHQLQYILGGEWGNIFYTFPPIRNGDWGQMKGFLHCPCALRAGSAWISYTLLVCLANSLLLSHYRECIYVQRLQRYFDRAKVHIVLPDIFFYPENNFFWAGYFLELSSLSESLQIYFFLLMASASLSLILS